MFIREYTTQTSQKESTRRIAISTFPTSLNLIEFAKLDIAAGAKVLDNPQATGKKGKSGTFLLAIGCKDGKTVVYKFNLSLFSGQYIAPLYTTKGGVGYGAVSAIDIQDTAENMVCATESGELLQYKLLEQLDQQAF